MDKSTRVWYRDRLAQADSISNLVDIIEDLLGEFPDEDQLNNFVTRDELRGELDR